MRYETTVEIKADPTRVWAALVDVEHWPQWTASMSEVRRLESEPLAIGSRSRIKQPGMPAMVWEVTGYEPEREFTWTARSVGVTTAGAHVVSAQEDGTTRLTLVIDQTGPLAPVVGWLTGARTRRFLQLEADGLRRCSERA